MDQLNFPHQELEMSGIKLEGGGKEGEIGVWILEEAWFELVFTMLFGTC